MGDNMDKPLIGIIAPRHVGKKDRVFQNMVRFSAAFPHIIYLAGGIPVGVFFPNNEFNKDIMNACDGFVFQGGSIIESSQLLAVKYALESRKPLLGVCLGMQTMATFDWLIQNGYYTDEQIINYYKQAMLERVLEKRKHHNNLDPFYLSKINKSKHEVNIDANSRLYNIYNKKLITVPSVHNYAIKEEALANSKMFHIIGRSNDGSIEAIEANRSDLFAIGVQFHPELEDANLLLFEETVSEARLVRKR